MIELEASYLIRVKSFIALNYNYLLSNYYVLDTILIIGDVKRKRLQPLGNQHAYWICYKTILSN